jgi:hypothetical protein
MPPFKQARDIKVGVIGYGGAFNMGRQHLTFMKHVSKFQKKNFPVYKLTVQ